MMSDAQRREYAQDTKSSDVAEVWPAEEDISAAERRPGGSFQCALLTALFTGSVSARCIRNAFDAFVDMTNAACKVVLCEYSAPKAEGVLLSHSRRGRRNARCTNPTPVVLEMSHRHSSDTIFLQKFGLRTTDRREIVMDFSADSGDQKNAAHTRSSSVAACDPASHQEEEAQAEATEGASHRVLWQTAVHLRAASGPV